jgi:hypothetical protein
MNTDSLLNKLRCAECRQIKFDHFVNVGIKAALVT